MLMLTNSIAKQCSIENPKEPKGTLKNPKMLILSNTNGKQFWLLGNGNPKQW